VIVPTRGYSLIDVEGGPLWDHQADMALVEALAAELGPDIPLERVDRPVNDPEFGRLVARRFLELAGSEVPDRPRHPRGDGAR
jgi:uncharacterized protein (UPF0261 family)